MNVGAKRRSKKIKCACVRKRNKRQESSHLLPSHNGDGRKGARLLIVTKDMNNSTIVFAFSFLLNTFTVEIVGKGQVYE